MSESLLHGKLHQQVKPSVQCRFFSILPAPEINRITIETGFHHIVHRTVVLKLVIMMPFQFNGSLFGYHGNQYQLRPADTADEPLFHLMPYHRA
jgi:hypothetical protein